MVDRRRELDIRVGEQDVGGDDLQAGDARGMDWERLALQDRSIDRLLFGEAAVASSRTLEELAWESMSTRRTRLPFRARPAASEMLVEVLPVPPF